MLANILKRYWWMTLLLGVIWILFGIAIFLQPAISLVTLTLLFGALVFADGVGNLITGFGGRKENEHWWVLVLAGVAGIVVGVLTFLNPAITGLVLLFYIAIWAIVAGLLKIVAAIRLRNEITGEVWLGLAGVLSIAFGVMVIARPGAGALAILWLIGGYAIVFGAILIALAFKSRQFVGRVGNALKGAALKA